MVELNFEFGVLDSKFHNAFDVMRRRSLIKEHCTQTHNPVKHQSTMIGNGSMIKNNGLFPFRCVNRGYLD